MWEKAVRKDEFQKKGPYRQKLLEDLYKNKEEA